MFKKLKKLQYGARVLLAQGGGREETVSLHGLPVTVRHGGEGPPLVYLHSTLGESIRWLPFHQGLADGFHVYAPTHPGFNLTPGFENIHDVEDLAFHYAELFDALGLDEMVLGGVSLGGWIAAEYAVRWPERVKKLWLCGAPGLWVDDAVSPDLFRVMGDRQAMRELLFYRPDSALAHLVISDEADEQQMLMGYQNMTVLARLVWERPYDPKLARRLHRIECPTLLLWGEHDRLVPPGHAEAYRRLLPQAEVRLIPECGHVPMFEAEHEFVAAVARHGRS